MHLYSEFLDVLYSAMRLITFSEPQSPSNPIFCNLQILNFFDLIVEVLNILLVHRHLNLELPSDTLQTLKFDKICQVSAL